MAQRRQRFAPLWVYLFGLFAVAALQRAVFSPGERSVAANVAFFFVGSVAVIAVLTVAQRATRR
jgi:hypothetical protein